MVKMASWYKTAQDADIPSAEKWIVSTAKQIMKLMEPYEKSQKDGDYEKVNKIMEQMHSLANVLVIYAYKVRDGEIKSEGCDKKVIQYSIYFANSI